MVLMSESEYEREQRFIEEGKQAIKNLEENIESLKSFIRYIQNSKTNIKNQ